MKDNINLDAYFERIEYAGSREPTVSVLHAITEAHTKSIPFENLDVLLGKPIDIEINAIFRKLVQSRRGGYCFEQNGLLLHMLGAIGFEVFPLSARVRLQRPRDYIPPRTHVFIRAEIDGESWLTDVGVGAASLTSAIRLHAEGTQDTPHEPRRVIKEGTSWFHQILYAGQWHDVCEFTLEEMPPIDRELGNWFTSTHPHSHFKSRLVVARALPNGKRLNVLNHDLNIRLRNGEVETQHIASAEELLNVLREHFDLQFPPGTQFGSLDSRWP